MLRNRILLILAVVCNIFVCGPLIADQPGKKGSPSYILSLSKPAPEWIEGLSIANGIGRADEPIPVLPDKGIMLLIENG